MTSFVDQFNKDKEQVKTGGGWYKITEGSNKLRIISAPEIFFEKFGRGICYHECGFEGSAKYLAHVLDYKDNQVKLMKIPYSIMETIVGYMTNDEYAFSAFPMPYDITIQAKNAGKKEVEYVLVPSRNNSTVPESAMHEYRKQKSVTEIIERMKEKQIEKDKQDGIYETKEERLARLQKEYEESGNKQEDMDTIEYPDEYMSPEDIDAAMEG